ncbi:MAG: hypothetical protein ABI995_11290, partial [Acidobacteriota bacterium]
AAQDQGRSMQLELEPGNVSHSLRTADQILPAAIRASASEGLKANGVHWMVASLTGTGAADMLERADEWGLEVRGVIAGYIIFHVK